MAEPNGHEAAAAPLPASIRQRLKDPPLMTTAGGMGDLRKKIKPKPSQNGMPCASVSGPELLQHSPAAPQPQPATPVRQKEHQPRSREIVHRGVGNSVFSQSTKDGDERPAKRMRPDHHEAAVASDMSSVPAAKTPDIAAEKGSFRKGQAVPVSSLEAAAQHDTRVPVSHVTRNESSGSVSSDISSASSSMHQNKVASSYNYTEPPEGGDEDDEDDPAMFSPVPKAFIREVPPAPPSTPASSASTSWDYDYGSGMGALTPLPIATVKNAQLLEEQQMMMEGAVTPAPTREESVAAESGQSMLRNAPQLPGDFDDWAVGDRYEMMRILGRGSYGEVAQARDLKSKDPNSFVAIKRIQSPFDQEVDAVRLYREMHILRQVRGHECIIQLLNVIQPPTDDLDDFHDLYLVFEYVDTDLYKLIMSPQYLTTQHIQTFLYQMLAGLKYIHSASVIHRDLKPANILLNENCSLKICDFGLARIVNADRMSKSQAEVSDNEKKLKPSGIPGIDRPPLGLTRQLTKHVVTRWYRAPELILIQPYTSAVDIWSVGCILGELLSMQQGNVETYQDRKPLFPGGTCFPLSGDGELRGDEKLDQLSVIFDVLGTPSDEDVTSIGKANEYIKSLGMKKPKPFESIYPKADPMAIDLLRQMLQFNPDKRCTAEEALKHEFFRNVRHPELEKDASAKLVAPSFLERSTVDLTRVKRETYDEVLCYRDQADGDRKPAAK